VGSETVVGRSPGGWRGGGEGMPVDRSDANEHPQFDLHTGPNYFFCFGHPLALSLVVQQ
jgi:hypothetical protein